MPGIPQLLSSEVVYKGRLFDVNLDTIKMDGGVVARRETLLHPGAVCMVPVDGVSSDGGWTRVIGRRLEDTEIRCDVQGRDEARCHRLDVALDARNLSSKKDAGATLQFETIIELKRRVDVGVAMDRTETSKDGLRQAGQCAKYSFLLADAKLRLTPDEIPERAPSVLLPKLHDCMRATTRSRINQAHRLHGPKRKGVPTPPGHLFNGQTALEIEGGFKSMEWNGFSAKQLFDERLVLASRERDIEIVAYTIVIA